MIQNWTPSTFQIGKMKERFTVSSFSSKDKRKEKRKRKERLSPMTKAPTPTEKPQKQRDNTKMPPKLRLHNDCRPTEHGQLE